MPQSLACLYAHIIFSTTDRVASITPTFQPRLYEYIGGILRTHGGILDRVGGTADHIHVLVSLGRDLSVAEVGDSFRTL